MQLAGQALLFRWTMERHLEDEVDHGSACDHCRASQGLQLPIQADDAIIDGVLDHWQLLADGVDEVRGQLAGQEACAHVLQV